MADQYTLQNPVTQYDQGFDKQQQEPPGLNREMTPKPDCGEETYRGTGRLEGRVAIITGGDSGIGRAAAIAFAREGADVVLSYLPEEQPDADEVAQLIKNADRRALLVPGDIRSEETCKSIVAKTIEEFGRLDCLINNAGMQQNVPDIADISSDQLRATYETNVFSMFYLCQAAIPHMKPGSTIINTTSIQAYQPSPGLLDYAGTKAAIANFTKGLALQLVDKGIRVNGVAPGPVWTPLQVTGGQPTEELPKFGEETPMGRAAQPAELAPPYVYLASQESSYTTGEIIAVTGGMPIS